MIPELAEILKPGDLVEDIFKEEPLVLENRLIDPETEAVWWEVRGIEEREPRGEIYSPSHFRKIGEFFCEICQPIVFFEKGGICVDSVDNPSNVDQESILAVNAPVDSALTALTKPPSWLNHKPGEKVFDKFGNYFYFSRCIGETASCFTPRGQIVKVKLIDLKFTAF